MTIALVIVAIIFGATGIVASAYHLGTLAGRRDHRTDDWANDADNGCICGLGECDPRCPACPAFEAERLVN